MKTADDDPLPTRWSLIARLKDLNDQQSWREFFDSYWKLIYRVALKAGLPHSEAEDVVQETVMSVCKHMPAFQADPAHGSFKSWLLQMTRWRIIDHIRARSREPQVQYRSEQETRSTRVEDRVADPQGNALDQIWEDSWRRHILEVGLDKVRRQSSSKHFQIFYLSAIKETPPAQIARTAGVSVDQVYLVKHRLTKLLEEAVKEAETRLG
jgi:RNA polymerase sigma-70 factor (ECF subfamily)